MKKIFVSVLILSMVLASCKTSKHATKSAYEPAIDNSGTEMVTEPIKEKVVEQEYTQPIVMKTEEVTIQKSNDKKLYAFYVIIGSFSITDNAYKLQDQQMAKGVQAVVLKSETGMLRVAALGSDYETDARSKITQIRKEFPDAWLLKTK